MKKLAFLAVLIVLAYGALRVWESPYFALWQIDKGLDERDPVLVERYVDLESVVKAAVDVTGAIAGDRLGARGTDVGSSVLGAIVGAVTRGVGEVASAQGAVELRRAIQEGRVQRGLGPFTVKPGWAGVGSTQRFDRSALVELEGTCDGHDAHLRVIFEEHDGAMLGHPRRWVLVGVDKDSLALLAKECRTS